MVRSKIVAVIPALNEERAISKVIRGVKKYVDEIILIDDACSDNTAIIAKQQGAIILCHKKTQGYDKSLDDGFVLAAKRGATIVLTFDGDGQHNPEDIPKILEPIVKGEADVVVGKRPHYPRITEYLFTFVARIKANIHDPLCGLKAYHIRVYKDIGYFDRVSSIGTQLMFNARKRGYKVVQRNITLNERSGTSRFGRPAEADWRIFKAMIRIILTK